MHSRYRTCALVTGLLCVLCVASLATAQDEDRAKVTLSVGATNRSGATISKASGGQPLAVGDTRRVALRATLSQIGGMSVETSETGSFDATRVSGGFVAGARATPPSTGAVAGVPVDGQYTWSAQVRLISVGVDAIKFEIDWTRAEDNGGSAQRVAGDVRTITLRPGDRHVLDFVNTSNKAIANLTLDVEAARVENPAFTGVGFAYDLWLVHETSTGQRITRRLSPVGRQGELVPFSFDQLAFPVDTAQPIDGVNGRVKMRLNGTILGRLKSDGSVDVALNPQMSVGTGNVPSSRPFGFATGSKTFATKLDETTSIEIPGPNGSMSWGDDAQAPATPRPGVRVSNGTTFVNELQFFAGTKTAIMITVHRQQ